MSTFSYIAKNRTVFLILLSLITLTLLGLLVYSIIYKTSKPLGGNFPDQSFNNLGELNKEAVITFSFTSAQLEKLPHEASVYEISTTKKLAEIENLAKKLSFNNDPVRNIEGE